VYKEAVYVTTTHLEQAIVQLAQERSAALVHKDVHVLERLLADEFHYINASGMLLTKAEYLQHYVEPPLVIWASQDMDDIVVRLYGETAVLMCRVHDQGRFGTEPFDAYYRSIFVWVRQHTAWRCVIGQTTATARPQ
jgi:hypothetical protein